MSRFQLNIWDVGGQKSLRSYWRNYFESTDGLVWVVDSADKMRLDDCKAELHKLLQEEVTKEEPIKSLCLVQGCQLVKKVKINCLFSCLQRLSGATLLVFANKRDLPGALSAEEIKDALSLDEIQTHHWQIVGCSAMTGDNLLEGIDWMINDIAARIFTMD